MDPVTYDFTGLTTGLASLGQAMVAPAALVVGAALVVAGIVWGYPKLLGLFKKTAK